MIVVHRRQTLKPLSRILKATDRGRAEQLRRSYADSIRKGKVHPHARHWQRLADLVGVSNIKLP